MPHCWPWQGLLQAASREAGCVLRLNFRAWILPTLEGHCILCRTIGEFDTFQIVWNPNMCLQFDSETAIPLHLKSNVLFFFSTYSQRQAIKSSGVVLLTCTFSRSSQTLRVIQPWNWNTASPTMAMPVVVSFLTKPLLASAPSARNLPIWNPIRQSTSYGRYRPSLVIIFVFFFELTHVQRTRNSVQTVASHGKICKAPFAGTAWRWESLDLHRMVGTFSLLNFIVLTAVNDQTLTDLRSLRSRHPEMHVLMLWMHA